MGLGSWCSCANDSTAPLHPHGTSQGNAVVSSSFCENGGPPICPRTPALAAREEPCSHEASCKPSRTVKTNQIRPMQRRGWKTPPVDGCLEVAPPSDVVMRRHRSEERRCPARLQLHSAPMPAVVVVLLRTGPGVNRLSRAVKPCEGVEKQEGVVRLE